MKKASRKTPIKILISGGNVTMASYCLRTDFWHDYLAFAKDAESAISKGDIRSSNRYLRAALTSLFAHLEGVTKAIEDQCTIPVEFEQGRLCDRTLNINGEARLHGPVPHMNFRVGKLLRETRRAHPAKT